MLSIAPITSQDYTRGQAALACVVAFVLFIGLAGTLAALTGVALPAPAVVAGAIAGAAVCVAMWFAMADTKTERRFWPVAAGVLVVVALILHQTMALGGAQVLNAFIAKAGARTQLYDMPFVQGGAFDIAVFCFVIGGLIGLVACALARRGAIVVPVVLALIAGAGMLTGWLDAGWWLAPFALGLLGCIGLKVTLASDGWSRRAPATALAGILAFVLVGSGIGAIACGGARTDSPVGGDVLAAIGWKLRYGDAVFAMPGGQLHNLGALDTALEAAGDEQVALHVETPQPTYEYLRGFVGERYASDAWEPLAADDVMADRGLFYWLDRSGFTGADQVSAAAAAAGYDGWDPTALAIETRNVRGDSAYEPYGCIEDANADEVTDLSATRRSADEREFAYDPSILRRAYIVQTKLEAVQTAVQASAQTEVTSSTQSSAQTSESGVSGSTAARTYLDTEGAYREFVYRIYTAVPDDVAAMFASLYGEPMQLTAEQAKLVVASFLGDTVSYSTEIATENGDTDFVTWFLTEQRSGYSVHYATAAALLMRYYGVPTRYVEGYVLNTAALQSAQADEESSAVEGASVPEDASAAEGASAPESASAPEEAASEEAAPTAASPGSYDLTEAQAHAWVEYYLDGVGWIPFDVTPGYLDASFYETTTNVELQELAQNWSIGEAKQDSTWTPPTTDDKPDDETPQPNPIFEQLEKLNLSWPWVLVGFLLTLIVAFIVRDRLLHAKLEAFLAQDHASAAVPFAYLVQLVRDCGGVALANAPFAQQAPAVEAAGLSSAASFEAAALANDAALFAQRAPLDIGGPRGSVEPDDSHDSNDSSVSGVSSVLTCIDEVRGSLQENTTKVQRFIQRHVRCLW